MRVTKVYTRKGDDGKTALVGGRRISKSDLRVAAYGTVDELSSFIGLARSVLRGGSEELKAIERRLGILQNQLFDLGAELATLPKARKEGMPRVEAGAVVVLEGLIDEYNRDLPALAEFVLPAGTEAVTALHVARAVARRAERAAVELHETEPLQGNEIAFLNRLSDLLFVMARTAARTEGCEETSWHHDPGGEVG